MSEEGFRSLASGEDGKNLFFDGSNKYGMSKMMESYIAGQLHCLFIKMCFNYFHSDFLINQTKFGYLSTKVLSITFTENS